MAYSLGEAARAAGVSKTSIRRSIDAGRISASKDAFGRWQIEPVELHRIYPPAGSVAVPPEQRGAPKEPKVTSTLEREVTLLREMLERERAASEAALAREREAVQREREINRALEAERDSWRQQAQRLLPSPGKPWWRFWR
jgi:hypothetical protein